MSAPALARSWRRKILRRFSLATQLLGLILVVTLVSALAVHAYVRQQQITETQNHLNSYTKVLSDRLSDYETLLMSAASFLGTEAALRAGTSAGTGPGLNRAAPPGADLPGFVSGLHLEEYFPSVHRLDALWPASPGQPLRLQDAGAISVEGSGNTGAGTPESVTLEPVTLGSVTLGPQAARLVEREVAAAMADGTTHVAGPFGTLGSADGGAAGGSVQGGYQALMIVQPCQPLAPGRTPPCALYMVVNVEQLLREVEQLTPVSGPRVRIALDGQPLLTAEQAGGGADQVELGLLGGGQARLIASAAAAQRVTPDLMRASVEWMDYTWTLETQVPQLRPSDPSTLLAPLVVAMGLLAGLFTHRLVSHQLRLNHRLKQANSDLGASQSFLEQSRADFSAIFQAMDGGAVFTTPDGFIRMVNRRYLDLVGLEFFEVVGAHIDEIRGRTVVDEGRNRHALFSAEAPEEYGSVVRSIYGAAGKVFSGELSRVRVTGQRQELVGYLHVVHDVSERIANQQRLRDQEQQSRAALDGVPHVLWLSNHLGRLTYANQQFRDLLSGPAVREQVHPEDTSTYNELWEDAYSSGQQQEADIRLALRTPEALFLHGQRASAPAPGWRWVSLKVAPLRTISGEVNEWIAVATDVHARLLAEQLALAEQDHYRMVLSGMPQLVWTVNAGWDVTYVNGRWYELQPGLPAPVNLADLASPVHPGDVDRFYQAVAQAREQSRPLEVHVRMVGPEGRYRTYVVRAVPLLEGDRVVEWVGTTTDVDDQVRAEFRARLMMQISDALSPAIDTQSSDLLIQRRSYQVAVDLLAESLGAEVALWRTDSLPGQRAGQAGEPGAGAAPTGRAPQRYQIHWMGQSFNLERDLTPDIMQLIEDLVQRGTARRNVVVDRMSPLLAQLGAEEFLLIPLLGHGGSLRGMLGLAYTRPVHSHDHELASQLAARFALALDNDVLRQRARQAQEDLQQLNRSLEQRVRERTRELGEANRELEAFSYSVSHDLRTPLRHMTGFGELLRKKLEAEHGELSAQAERYLSVILESGQRMGHLIDDLLEFSRTGRAELRQQEVDLSRLVTEVWGALQPDREGRSVALHVAPLPAVYGDERLLGQVFTNLLSNALKYSRTKEEVLIQVRSVPAGDDMTEIQVQDNGAGFDPRYTDKLFGVFQRLHKNDEFEGTGIGLANVRRIIQRHGGRVWAQGELGVGATFSVTLPLRPRPEAEPEPESGADPSPDSAPGVEA